MDRLTGLSLGYGFVKYSAVSAAQHAIAALNGYQLHNKRLKVSVSKPPTTDKKTNLYISGLPQHWTESELTRLVSPYGTVLDVRLLYESGTHRCKGVGFAKFESGASATAAIAALTGQTVDGAVMPLIVRYADTTSDKVRKAMAGAGGAAAVGGMGGAAGVQSMMARQLVYGQYASSPAALAAIVQQQQRVAAVNAAAVAAAGDTSNGYYAQHAANGVSPTTAAGSLPYIQQQLHQPTPMQAAVNHTTTLTSSASTSSLSSSSLSPPPLPQPPPSQPHHQHQQQPQPLHPSSSHPHPEFTGVCLFVYHLPLEASESTLFSLFSAYGQVTSARVMRDLLTGRSKGFGFVNVSRHDEAAAAIDGLNGFQLGNKYLKVTYKK